MFRRSYSCIDNSWVIRANVCIYNINPFLFPFSEKYQYKIKKNQLITLESDLILKNSLKLTCPLLSWILLWILSQYAQLPKYLASPWVKSCIHAWFVTLHCSINPMTQVNPRLYQSQTFFLLFFFFLVWHIPFCLLRALSSVPPPAIIVCKLFQQKDFRNGHINYAWGK